MSLFHLVSKTENCKLWSLDCNYEVTPKMYSTALLNKKRMKAKH